MGLELDTTESRGNAGHAGGTMGRETGASVVAAFHGNSVTVPVARARDTRAV
jgi:hypothetical protein